MLHIYTARFQPATCYTFDLDGEQVQLGFEPDAMIYTDCCRKKRPAKDCVVQCYYDHTAVWCAQDSGCKDPQVVAERKAREFANRSAGQKARWAKASN